MKKDEQKERLTEIEHPTIREIEHETLHPSIEQFDHQNERM